ncbi:hypothetical protein [Actinacidiphila sp. ITFR-21]|uniref:hypothetical protein n=1 Tax=Actinacidiphila sp. ITFR-21 TaxID=3075199 RepID=UPI002889092B|nr:hypothetical protein [Streptomyces sp. ITFR-21]WNI20302.1 hypothetical protein RLT57_33075 [Streptomyces sp. ITFR-21]
MAQPLKDGDCWLCDGTGVLVMFLGPVQTDGGTAPFEACEPCVLRLEARVLAYNTTGPGSRPADFRPSPR